MTAEKNTFKAEINVKWVKSLSPSYNRTWFSFSYDPRGGFWYQDTNGKKLVRFCTANGDPIEEILIADLVQEPWPINTKYYPSSCITIFENDTNLNAIVSARVKYDPLNLYNNYVLAINLSNNSLLWKVKVDESGDSGNYANGQYTILMDEYRNNHRVVFGTHCDGVIAIGANDLCCFPADTKISTADGTYINKKSASLGFLSFVFNSNMESPIK